MRYQLQKQFLPMAVAATLTALGFMLLFGLFKTFSPQKNSDVILNIKLLGRNNRPIAQSEIWLTRPENRLLGVTREDGKARLHTVLPKGQLAVIEARGATFRASKEVPIPNIDTYEVRLVLDEVELAAGNMTLETRTLEKRTRRAVEQYSSAVQNKIKTENSERAHKIIVVAQSNQPDLSIPAKTYLAKMRAAFQKVAEKSKYSLQKQKIHQISLRLLRSQDHYLELSLFDSELKLRGSKLLPVSEVKENQLASILHDALSWQHDAGVWPKNAPSKSRFWYIRKRPIDTLRMYLNGEPLVTRSKNDQITALLPNTYQPGTKWRLAAASQSGLLVIKDIDASQTGRPLVWNWPEWLMSQKSASQEDKSP